MWHPQARGTDGASALDREVLRLLEGVREIGPGLKEVAKAGRELPAAVAKETHLARQMFDGGLLTGGVIGLVVGLVLGIVLGRKS